MSGTPAIEFEGRRFGVQRMEGEAEGSEGSEGGRSGADQDGLTVGGRVRDRMLPSEVLMPLMQLQALSHDVSSTLKVI